MCPSCRSLERQRLVWLYLLTETDLRRTGSRRRLLHVSPDPSLRLRLDREPWIEQITADLDPAGVMVQMDITDIDFPDGFFDIIYCSHVLEHVPDDSRAMRELCRVLAPGGFAILQVPLWDIITDEDPSITDELERTRRFGQRDHVRRYGRDYPERLAWAGFDVTVDPYPRRIGRGWVQRFGLTLQEEIHLARKPKAGGSGSVTHPLAALSGRGNGTVGRVEQVAHTTVWGWAWQPTQRARRPVVRMLIDGEEVGSAVADLKRVSLANAGIGDGSYGFRIPLPPATAPHHHLRIETEDGAPLPPAARFTTEPLGNGDPLYVVDVAVSGQAATWRATQ
jgi:Methyltransferase domain